MDFNIKLLPFGDFFPIVLLAASSQQRALWPLTRVPLGGNLILPALNLLFSPLIEILILSLLNQKTEIMH